MKSVTLELMTNSGVVRVELDAATYEYMRVQAESLSIPFDAYFRDEFTKYLANKKKT